MLHQGQKETQTEQNRAEQNRTEQNAALTADVLHFVSHFYSNCSCEVTNANINYQHIHLTSGLKVRQCLLRCTMEEHNMSNLSQIRPRVFKDNLK